MFFLFKAKTDGNGGSHVNRTPLQIKAIVGTAMSIAVAVGWIFNQAFAYTELKKDVKRVCAESLATKARVDSLYSDIKVLKSQSSDTNQDVRDIRNFLLGSRK